jgi:hypothetical protein
LKGHPFLVVTGRGDLLSRAIRVSINTMSEIETDYDCGLGSDKYPVVILAVGIAALERY